MRSLATRIWTVMLPLLLLLAAIMPSLASAAPQAQAAPAANDFWSTWARTDKPVADGIVSRTWMWGPEAYSGIMQEPYGATQGATRTVQYFDKSRMEKNAIGGAGASAWSVTNGLLVIEMMSGQLQVDDARFEQRAPSALNVAGDPDGTTGPTYASLNARRNDPATPVGSVISATVDRAGNTSALAPQNTFGVTAAHRVSVPGIDHTVASVFWDFMQSSGIIYNSATDAFVNGQLFANPFYATGYPVTEAYWTTVQLGGQNTQVLLQCFERRCLTFTPTNAAGWQVEAGNVGQHYYMWRYGQFPKSPTLPETPTPPSSSIPGTGDLQIESVVGAGSNEEHVIIRNMQLDGEVNLQGWTMRDEDGHVYTFPYVTVKAGFYVTVWVCGGYETIGRNYAYLVWGICEPFYDGDTIRLYDASGTEVDYWPSP